MGNKNKGLTYSQIIGITWLSVALLLMVVAVIFLRDRGRDEHKNALADSSAVTVLRQKEDSAYRARETVAAGRYSTGNSVHRQRYADRRPDLDSSFYTTTPPVAIKKRLVVELNNADTLTLQLLHGIGPVFARRIVTYRERLGGFRSTDQLLEVYGFTPQLLEHIAPYLTLDTASIRRIDINTIELKQLIRHPYIDYYQARDIVALRNRGTHFGGPDDLRAVPSMSDTTLERLLPYVDFN